LELGLVPPLFKPDDLLVVDWKQLRSQVVSWQEEGQQFNGFDGSTRFWCTDAIFDIYWVAQRELKDEKYGCYLTEDLELTGFKEALPFQVSYEWKVRLAEKLQWRDVVEQILSEASASQLELFEDQ